MRIILNLLAMAKLCPALILSAGLLLPGSAQSETVRVINSEGEDGVGHTFLYKDSCRVLTVAHHLEEPGLIHMAFAPDEPRPDEYNLRLLEAKTSWPWTVDAVMASLSDWDRPCGPALTGPTLYTLATRLEAVNENPRAERFVVQLIDGTTLRNVTVWPVGAASGDYFTIAGDPSALSAVLSGNGISGSGVFIGNDLVGLVTGAALDGTPDAYAVLRLEAIVQGLDLEKTGLSAAGSGAADGTSVGDRQTWPAPAPPATTLVLMPPDLLDCDRLAAHPGDSARHPGTAGVMQDDVDLVQAELACKQDLEDHPQSARLAYQYSRVLALGFRGDPENYPFEDAVEASLEALDLGHVQAIVSFENILYKRGTEQCGGTGGCDAAYLAAIERLRPFAPDEADFRRGEMLAFSKNRAETLCPDLQACDLEAAELFAGITTGPRKPLAGAHLAFLIMDRDTPWKCENTSATEDNCFSMMRRAFRDAAEAGVTWGNYQLGRLYRLRGLASGTCADDLECNRLAVKAWRMGSADGDARGLATIASVATQPGWGPAVGCKDDLSCRRLAFDYYSRAAEAGHIDSNGEAARILLRDAEAAGCADSATCQRAMRPFLLNKDFAKTNWGKNFLADQMIVNTEYWSDLCDAPNCLASAKALYLQAAGNGSGYAAERLAELHQWADFYEDAEIRLAALGCTDARDCLSRALDFHAQAFELGQEGTLDRWLTTLGRMETIDAARWAAWQSAVDRTGIGKIPAVDATLIQLAYVAETGDADGSIAAILCRSPEDWCRRQADAVLKSTLADTTGAYAAKLIDTGYADAGSASWREILLHAAATDPGGYLVTAAFAGMLDEQVCRGGGASCAADDRVTIRAMIEAASDTVRLSIGEHFTNGYIKASRMSDDADLRWLMDQAIAAGSLPARLARAREMIGALGTWQEMPDADASFAATAFLDRLHPGNGSSVTHEYLCAEAWYLSDLVWTKRYFGTLDTPYLADLGMLRLAHCNVSADQSAHDAFVQWLGYLDKEVTRTIQRQLGLKNDGIFGPDSSFAAARLYAGLREKGSSIMLTEPRPIPNGGRLTADELAAIEAATEAWSEDSALSRLRNVMEGPAP